MSDKVLYSVTGIFDTPDEITHAAKEMAEKGYKKFDVNTPYPLHGMNDAMKLPASKLGYAALVFGLSGTLAALSFMYFTSVIDYPNIIGGKPFFSFPAFVPIMFEVTVLSASIATVVTMLFFFFKFPNNRHPLNDTSYMKMVSSDKYGISIQAEDVMFNQSEVEKLLAELGAKFIQPIYFDEEEFDYKHKLLEPKFLGLLAVIAVITSGTVYFSLNKLMFYQPFSWMMEQNKLVPQETSTVFADGFSMQTPVKGTVARGILPYPYYGKPDLAGEMLINPLVPSKENLKLGEEKFNVFCSPCHGYHGEGDSRLRGQFPNPPSLHSEKVRNWSDGRIYHVLVEGQNVMPSYSYQLNREEKWSVVLYLRALQRSLNAKESDIE